MSSFLLFEQLSSLIEKQRIQKKRRICLKNKNKIFKNSELEEKTIKVKEFYLPYRLETGSILIIKDLAQHFFLSHSLLIGEHCSLKKISLEGFREDFIISEEDLKDFPLPYFSKEEFETKELYLKAFESPFEELDFLSTLKKETWETQQVNLSQIHFVKGKELGLFLPTIHSQHLELAEKLNIPLFPLIENNFFRSSGIHIFDFSSQEKALNALCFREIQRTCFFEKENANEVFFDLEEELILYFNEEDFLDRELFSQIEPYLELLKKEKKVLLASRTQGKVLLPLWSSSNHSLYSFKSLEECETISGLYYRNQKDYLSKLYLQDEHGKKLHFLSFYLKEEFLAHLKKLDAKEIVFSSISELLFLLSFSKNPQSIREELLLKKTEEKELQKHSQKLFSFLLSQIAQNKGKLPSSSSAQSFFSKIFNEYAFEAESLRNELETHQTTLKDAYTILRTQLISLSSALDCFEINEEEAFFLAQYLKKSLQVLDFFNNELFQKLKDEFKEINTSLESFSSKKSASKQEVFFFLDLIEAQKQIKNGEEILLYIKNSSLSLPNLQFTLPSSRIERRGKSFLSPDLKSIEKKFPYLKDELLEKLKGIKKSELPFFLTLKNRRIQITEDFFIEKKVYEEYKILEKREEYELLLKKRDK